MKPRPIIKPWLFLLLLAGCTSLPSPEGQRLVEQGQWREGLPKLEAEAARKQQEAAELLAKAESLSV